MFFWESVAYAMGAAPQGDGGAGGNPITAFAPLVIMFVIFYFLLIRPQQKKAKEHKELLAGVTRGDHVLTVGGVFGRVMDANGEELTVNIGTGSTEMLVKVHRNYIAMVTNSTRQEKKKDKAEAPEKKE